MTGFKPRPRPGAFSLVLSLASGGLSVGCGVDLDAEAPPPASGVATAQAPIEGGTIDEDTTHVVGLVRLGEGGIATCSGTLIAPNTVLTAQHCVAQSSGNGFVQCGSTNFFPPFDADNFFVTTRTSLSQDPADYYRGAEMVLPPGGEEFCDYDVAILILETPVPADEAVPAPPRVDIPLTGDEVYDAVGYGQTGPSGRSGTRYRRNGLITQCVGAECAGRGSAQAREWIGDEGACQGDSGGPALDSIGRVVGVLSRGTAGSCDEPVYAHVQGWSTWIQETTAYATSSRGLEVPAWTQGFETDPAFSDPVGGACVAPADCASNACREEGYCTRPCSDRGPCPEGYVCAEDGFCAEAPPPPPEDEDDGSADDDDGGRRTISAGCHVSAAPPQDPTKPIPWVTAALVLVGAFRRRVARS